MKFNRVITAIIFVFLFAVSSRAQRSDITFYIAPDGNDLNPGTEAAPFKSLDQARKSVSMRLQKTPDRSILVNIKGGRYYMEAPVVFTSEDSGKENHPVVYKAADGAEPIFTGSRELKKWQLLSDPEKLGLLSPAVKGKVYVCDVKAAGISNFGDPTDIGKRPELFCNGEVQILARWPNTGFVKSGLVKGKTPVPENYTKKRGTVEGIFEYVDPLQDRWAAENDIRLGGYWYWDWSDEYQKVEKMDTRNKVISLRKPYHHYGYKDSLRYFGLNLFREIDAPGEWYLDRTDGLLYWFPPEGIVPGQAKVSLSVFDAPFMVEMKDCSNVILDGLGFEEGRGSAISITDGNNCFISNCRVERFGKDGIHITDGRGHNISGCLLRTFGCGGIKIKGGDRKTLTPANHVIENSVVEHFSLFINRLVN